VTAREIPVPTHGQRIEFLWLSDDPAERRWLPGSVVDATMWRELSHERVRIQADDPDYPSVIVQWDSSEVRIP
jgi:hypothetical protein